jgi:hypothetical protein
VHVDIDLSGFTLRSSTSVKSSPSRKEQLLALRQINLDGRRRPYRPAVAGGAPAGGRRGHAPNTRQAEVCRVPELHDRPQRRPQLADERMTSDQIAARSRPSTRAIACSSLASPAVAAELVGLTRKAIDLAAGTSSCSSLSRFAIASTLLTVTPVRLTPANCTTSSVCRDTVVSLSRGLHDLGLNLLDDGRHKEFDADQLANTCSASAVSTPVDEAANSGSKKIKPQPGE